MCGHMTKFWPIGSTYKWSGDREGTYSALLFSSWLRYGRNGWTLSCILCMFSMKWNARDGGIARKKELGSQRAVELPY